MTDVLTPQQRSYCMSQIQGKDTHPELLLRRALWHLGYRYRLHRKALPGRPDLVFATERVAVFVDGCFFHGCPEHFVEPATNTSFWVDKIDSNRRRDRKVTETLRERGWTVVRVWEHEVRAELERSVEAIVREIEARRARRI